MSPVAAFKKIEVWISPDAMRATVRIPAFESAEPITPSLIAALAKDEGIVIDKDLQSKLEDIVAEYNANPTDTEVEIATGSPPGPATPATIQWAAGFDPTSPAVAPHDDPDNAAPDKTDHYASRAEYVRVKPGDRLGVLFPPDKGIHGRNVLGEPIEPDDPADPDATVDQESITLAGDASLVANIGGILTFHNRRASIDELLTIDSDVDFSTGHVQTEGSLVVQGGVKDNFRVHATGAIEIRGLVEAAHIHAGKDLKLSHGVAGRERAELTVDGDLAAGYINDTKVRVGGSVFVKREIVGSQLVAGGSLIAERASIIGGATMVTDSLRVGSLGCASETPTLIVLGYSPYAIVNYWELTERLNELTATIAGVQTEIDSLRAKPRLDNVEKERLTELQFDAQSLTVDEERLESEIARFRRLQQNTSRVDLVVSSMIYPNVTLATAKGRLTITTPIKGLSQVKQHPDGQMFISSNSGAPMPLANFCRGAA